MLNRWDPFREMNQLRRAMDRVFDDTLERRWSDQDMGLFDQTYSALALDVLENDDAFLVKAALPGIDPKDLDITYNNDTLTIQGECQFTGYNAPQIYTHSAPEIFTNHAPLIFTKSTPVVFGQNAPPLDAYRLSSRSFHMTGRNHDRKETQANGHPRTTHAFSSAVQ